MVLLGEVRIFRREIKEHDKMETLANVTYGAGVTVAVFAIVGGAVLFYFNVFTPWYNRRFRK